MLRLKKLLTLLLTVFLFGSCSKKTGNRSEKEAFKDELISEMTLAEKVEQMTLYSSDEDPAVSFNAELSEKVTLKNKN